MDRGDVDSLQEVRPTTHLGIGIIDETIDPWHYELMRLGFEFRWAYPGELAPDGRKLERVYWKPKPVRI